MVAIEEEMKMEMCPEVGVMRVGQKTCFLQMPNESSYWQLIWIKTINYCFTAFTVEEMLKGSVSL